METYMVSAVEALVNGRRAKPENETGNYNRDCMRAQNRKRQRGNGADNQRNSKYRRRGVRQKHYACRDCGHESKRKHRYWPK